MLDKICDFLNDELKQFETEDITDKQYASMKYPKLIPLMKFNVEQKRVKDFGSVMAMKTNAMGGKMKLATISFMPNSGKDVPYLLIDCMSMEDKRTVFVEYYDCNGKYLDFDELEEIKNRYSDLAEYEEKPAWYISERMDVSLIKGGSADDEDRLVDMVKDSIHAYFEIVKNAKIDIENLEGLYHFQDRMIYEGNPSSSTMEKVLGKKGAVEFFKKAVMPLE